MAEYLSLGWVKTTKELHCSVGISRSSFCVPRDSPTLIRVRDSHSTEVRSTSMDQLQTTTHTASTDSHRSTSMDQLQTTTHTASTDSHTVTGLLAWTSFRRPHTQLAQTHSHRSTSMDQLQMTTHTASTARSNECHIARRANVFHRPPIRAKC